MIPITLGLVAARDVKTLLNVCRSGTTAKTNDSASVCCARLPNPLWNWCAHGLMIFT